MIIRHATIDDAKPVVEFLRQFRAENLQTVLWREAIPSIHEEARFINRLNDESGAMLIALSGNVVIGCLIAEVKRHPQLRHSCEFGISVLQAHRSVGVGSALINGLLAWSLAKRIRRIELNVFSNNPGAIRLYQRLGFREEGRKIEAVYVEPDYVDLVEMALTV
jgi:ribosomal-protein-alanine N-acetyltransferase